MKRFAKSSPDAAANLDVVQKALYCNLEPNSNSRVRKKKRTEQTLHDCGGLMTVTQQFHTSVCVSMSAFASCIWDTVERRLPLHACGCDAATQLFNLRLYVCFDVLHASGTRSRGGYCYMHAGASGVFCARKHCQLFSPALVRRESVAELDS